MRQKISSVLTKGIAFPAIVFFTAGLAFAQNDWTVISTAGDPDPINTFDLANPAGSQSQIGFVATNFNRGMDYFGADSFYYYVSTDTLNDPGQRGLWSWVGGVNTQLATVGFSDTGDGDATYDFGANQFFVTVDDQDSSAGDSLYVWDNLNSTPSFFEVGETGLSQLTGLAVDPSNGTLYGYDSETEALYTLDRNSGAATMVGFSGLTLGSIGGMDFNGDGSTLLLSNGDDLFTVDKTTGALTGAGILNGLNTSALAYNNVNAIPEPASVIVLGIGSLFVIRRRRTN